MSSIRTFAELALTRLGTACGLRSSSLVRFRSTYSAEAVLTPTEQVHSTASSSSPSRCRSGAARGTRSAARMRTGSERQWGRDTITKVDSSVRFLADLGRSRCVADPPVPSQWATTTTTMRVGTRIGIDSGQLPANFRCCMLYDSIASWLTSSRPLRSSGAGVLRAAEGGYL